MILNTDKNLGIAVIKREEYVLSIYIEHFSHADLYAHKTEYDAKTLVETANQSVINSVRKHFASLSYPEQVYFNRGFREKYRHALFYGLPKIHKPKKNGYYRTRPVVSKCGTFLELASKWIDYQLQRLTHLFPSHLKDSFHLLQDLSNLKITPNTRIFTADAVSMYSYIDTCHAKTVISEWFLENEHNIPLEFPTNLVLSLLTIVMENNIFQFGDLWYHQVSGTAMGTSVAPIYALLYYGIHENNSLLPEFGRHIIYYRRFIDDVLVLWEKENENDNTHESFRERLPFGRLQWTMDTPGFHAIFLDLDISLVNGTIKTKTHHKPLNLHLYIPPKSAHPPKVLYSLIFGSIRRYWLQNTTHTNFKSNVAFLYEKLCNRGHDRELLSTLFKQASSNFVKKYGNERRFINKKDKTAAKKRTFYLHLEHHPRGLRRQWLHEAYQQTISKLGFYEKQIVCLSRPRNLRDMLIPSKLSYIPGRNPSNLFPLREV